MDSNLSRGRGSKFPTQGSKFPTQGSNRMLVV